MSYDPQPTMEELEARTSASVAANEYGILRISPPPLRGGEAASKPREVALKALYGLTHSGTVDPEP
jgi:hypothetical protein